jgi:transposase-like protein
MRETKATLEDLLREGARNLLQAALESEIQEHLDYYRNLLDAHGRRLVVKAVECLTKDFDDLFAFYDFPAEHWCHIRTTNPIESTFATVRLRHRRTKGNGTRQATLTMVYKLCREAEKNWRRLDGYKILPLVVAGRTFKNGELADADAA